MTGLRAKSLLGRQLQAAKALGLQSFPMARHLHYGQVSLQPLLRRPGAWVEMRHLATIPVVPLVLDNTQVTLRPSHRKHRPINPWKVRFARNDDVL